MRVTSRRLLMPLLALTLLLLASVAQGVARAGGPAGAVYTASNDGSATALSLTAARRTESSPRSAGSVPVGVEPASPGSARRARSSWL